MASLKEIGAIPKQEQIAFSNYGIETNESLLGFWRWSVSDILNNATSGRFATFIVATAGGGHAVNLRDESDAYGTMAERAMSLS